MNELPDLIGNLIVLRQLNIERDVVGYFNVSHDKNMHLWVGNRVPNNIEEINELLNIYKSKMYVWSIFDKQTLEIIGLMRLSYPETVNGKISSGDSQRIHSNYWRRGFMKEARKMVYEYAYSVLKIEMLYADVWEGNENSLESLKSVGYQIIDRKVEYFQKEEKFILKYYLELNLENWYKKVLKKSEI